MGINSKKSWINTLIELIEVLLKSMRKKRPQTWHQHVVPNEKDWAVRREGNKKISSKHRRQDTAIKKAKVIARRHKADVIIHRQDGTIRDRINYD